MSVASDDECYIDMSRVFILEQMMLIYKLRVGSSITYPIVSVND